MAHKPMTQDDFNQWAEQELAYNDQVEALFGPNSSEEFAKDVARFDEKAGDLVKQINVVRKDLLKRLRQLQG